MNAFDQFDTPNPFDRFDETPRIELRGMAEKTKPEPVQDFSGTLRFGPLDTGIRLPESVNRRIAQFGSGIADLGYAFASPEEVDAKRARDAQLNDDFGGKVLSFGGKALPSLALPTLGGPVIGGALAGTTMGALEPVGTGDSRLANTLVGGAVGGAIPAAVSGARNLIRPDAKSAELARRAVNDYGIPLSPADISSNGFTKGARSLLDDIPVIGRMGANQRQAKQEGFNRAVGATFGAPEKSLTPDVIDAARARMGQEFDRLWNRNTLQVDPQMVNGLQALRQNADKLPRAEANRLVAELDDLFNKMVPDQSGALHIPGDVANRFQSSLAQKAGRAQGFLKEDLNALRQEVIRGFNRGLSPDDAAALTANRGRYKAYKTVEPILNKADAAMAGRVSGDVPAGLLPGAVLNSYGRAAGTPFDDLSKIGGRFMVDRTPQIGGSPRAMLQNSVLGSALSFGAYSEPITATLGLGSAATLEKILSSPALARRVLNESAPRSLLDSPSLAQTLRELTGNAAYRAPIGAGLLGLTALE